MGPSSRALKSTTDGAVNWLLIVLCVTIVIITSFFLFYFNRLLAGILAFTLRSLLWKGNNVWIDLDAIQFSLLAGRLMIKDVRYYSTNMSVRIIKLHITWRYWFWRSRVDSDSAHVEIPGEVVEEKSGHLPCRLEIVADGVEWFIYNRTPAYDDILRHMQPGLDEELLRHPTAHDDDPPPKGTTSIRTERGTSRSRAFGRYLKLPFHLLAYLPKWAIRQLPTLQLKDIVPVGINILRGAITMGNDSTPSIFIANFRRASGTFGLQPSRSRCDPYKQVYGFKFSDVKIYTRVNRDHDESMRRRGEKVVDEIRRMSFMSHTSNPSAENFLFKAFHMIAPRLFRRSSKVETSEKTNKKWTGLPRYQTQDEKSTQSNAHEYAKLSTILETPTLELTYYADVAGPVPLRPKYLGRPGLEAMDVGNGDLAPEWGVDFVIHGGQINYGPWTDRQRRALQEAFFPPTFYQRRPTEMRRPGDIRLHVALKLLIEIRDEVKIRLPTREQSKNWRYDAAGDLGPPKLGSRPFGWLDVTVGANSRIAYDMSMVAHDEGFESMLQLHFDTVAISSSVNQSRFLFADSCRVICEMPSPLQWNAHRQWTFDISLSRPHIYLLRDHITLITDLTKDWTSGPLTEYHRFVPITYVMRVAFRDVHISMYLNDHNVIDYPLVDAQNTLLSLSGTSLTTEVRIPSVKYRPMTSTVTFSVDAAPLDVGLNLPNWNTGALLATKAAQSVGQIGSIRVNGTYMSFADVRPGNVDVLKININARDVLFKAFGRTIHHLMRVRENYFGNFTNFSTRNEYLEKRERGLVGDPVLIKYRKGKSNMFQVSIQLEIQDSAILLPSQLHDLQSATLIRVPEHQMLINLHDHFMELNINSGPCRLTPAMACSEVNKVSDLGRPSSGGLVLSDLSITGNRLFGEPPQNPTYLCLWEVRLGQLLGSASTGLVNTLSESLGAFRTSVKNALDSVAEEFRVVYEPDITFLKVDLRSIDLTWSLPRAAIRLLITDGLTFSSNDLPGKTHSTTKSITIPSVKLQCLLAQLYSDTRRPEEWLEVASASFDVNLDMYGAPAGWRRTAHEQKLFVQSQDLVTRRATWIYDTDAPQPSGYRRDHSLLLPVVLLHKPNARKSAAESLSDVSSVTQQSVYSSSELSASSDGDDGDSGSHLTFNAERRRVSKSFADPLAGNDADLSSGDESDEDAHGTSEASGSDVESFTPSAAGLHVYRGSLSRYRKLPASRYSGVAFALDTSRPSSLPIVGDQSPSHIPPHPCAALSASPAEADGETDVTIIRLQSKQANELFITPMTALALRLIIEEQQSMKPSVEKELDKLFGEFVASHKVASVAPKKMFIQGQLLQSTVSILQAVDVDHGLSEVLLKHDLGRSRGPLLGLLTATLSGGSCNGFLAGSSASFNASYTSAFVGVRIGRHPLRPSFPHLLSGQLAAHSSSLSVRKDTGGITVSPAIGKVTLDVPGWSPSVLYQMTRSFGAAFAPLLSQVTDMQRSWKHERQRMLSDLLQAASTTAVTTDPLSRTQVSFMVNSGTPRALRADPALAVLVHMRSTSRHFPNIRANEPHNGTDGNDGALDQQIKYSLIDMAERNLVDMQPEEVADSFVYQHLCATPKHDSPAAHVFPLMLALTFQRIVFNVGDVGEPQNQVELGPGDLRVQLADRLFTQAQPLATNKTSTSLLPLDPDQPIFHAVISGSVGLFRITVQPSLLSVIRGAIRLSGRSSHRESPPSPLHDTTEDTKSKLSVRRLLLVEVFVALEQMEVRAVAQVLSVGLKFKGARITTSAITGNGVGGQHSRAYDPPSISLLAGFREFTIQARSRGDEDVAAHPNRAVLASLAMVEGDVYVATNMEDFRSTVTLTALKLNVPRSALKLYTFVKQWEAEYLPAYNAMFRGILSELDVPSPKRTSHSKRSTLKSVDFQAQFSLISVSLHVMHGTWLSWALEDLLVYTNMPQQDSITYGVQLAGQRITLSGEPDEAGTLTPSDHSVKLALPSLRVSGAIEKEQIQASFIVDHFRLMLKPQYLDDILVVQQKFGNDFNELVDVLATNKPKKSSKQPSVVSLSASVKFEGFRIGIQGPSSTQYLQSPRLFASYQTGTSLGTRWRFDVREFELSLAHDIHVARYKRLQEQYNSASMTLDFVVHNDPPETSVKDAEYLTVKISEVHALMAPAAISELGNLVDHVQAEMLQRKRDRALELEGMKTKTRHVIKKFEGPETRAPVGTAFRNRIISVVVEDIGIAFPLSIRSSLDSSPATPSAQPDAGPVPAFLFSIASLSFATQREESGNARIAKFAFQFVPAFDQRRPDHFSSASHPLVNCMIYPEMSADIRVDTSSTSRKMMIRSAVSGFELDLSPSLPTYVFGLIDVYRHGKEQLERFIPNSSETASGPDQRQASATRTSSANSDYSAVPTSEILMCLDFQSGKVRFHVDDASSAASNVPIVDSSFQDPSLPPVTDSDDFKLPNVSVWLEYHATPAAHKISPAADAKPSRLIFNAIIHSSHNTIKPSLLPFVAEVTRQVEARLAEDTPSRTRPRLHQIVSTTSGSHVTTTSAMGSMEMIFSLRIDQSKLEFTCLPDVNVSAGLHWKSGGFVLRVAPEARDISLVGSIDGMSTSLRHGYLVDDCVNASARGLAFAVSFSEIHETGRTVNAVSIVVDTEIIGSVRFGRLQDVLCFKAVWLDRIPVFESRGTEPSSPVIMPVIEAPKKAKAFMTSILVQVESLQFDVDLGQSITKLTLDLRPVIIRTRLTDEFVEISVNSQLVKLDAVRAISGRISLPDLSFETIRRRGSRKADQRTLLELAIRTGELSASVNYEGKKILLLRSDPLEARVHDEWDNIIPGDGSKESSVRLDFSVTGGNLRASARVMTASELIRLGGRVNALMQAQKEGAARESKVFAAARSPKPQNPLSQVASAMVRSARSKLKEVEHLNILVVQHMNLEIGQIRLGIFNETDTRMTQFEADGVHGELIRHVHSDDTSPHRDLRLSLLSFEVRNGDVPPQDKWLDFLSGAKVFTMPEMVITMKSTEYTDVNRIDYEFRSTFPRETKARAGQRTLYIALDFHKYEQLMAMQSAFKEAIEKALIEIGQSPQRPQMKNTISVQRTADLPGIIEDPHKDDVSFIRKDARVEEPGGGGVETDVSTAPDLSTIKVGMRGLTYHCLTRTIETPKLHQLGAASPDLETFKQWTNISIRDSLPVWIHEYATVPIEQLMKGLLEVYIKQLKREQQQAGVERVDDI